MCPIFDGYGVMGIFQFPYTPSCEPRLRCKRCQLTRPPSYRQSSFRISTLGRYLRNSGKVGWVSCSSERAVHNRAAA